ncbi:outer membrane lipoprotein carrier protein LolA [Algoriphagus sp. D3-2-R+10]|uniref:LolA family protein n=1 Tax=Algoriphagus aurantiacus TaxID=3103948 RepID=UPI002B3CA398|nr:outer membrane lipoprotein carrier protein LolA [Algoriphagus sp. D3-2-R+10]MEB2777804.1 outer membrane lipoprotein carrier protein LolA [Algoriphagus sp. D3-2-R+10]
MRFLLNLILFISLSIPAFAQNQDAAFATKLQEHYKTVNFITADFTQRKQSLLFDEPLVSSGLFYYENPDRIRWEQREPSTIYFILTKDEIIQFDGESIKKSTGLNMQMSIFRQFILSTVDGSILNDPSFEKRFQSKNGKMAITLLPVDKRMTKRLTKIELVFDEKTLLLDQLKMFENQDDSTEINFTNQKINTAIPPSIFQ